MNKHTNLSSCEICGRAKDGKTETRPSALDHGTTFIKSASFSEGSGSLETERISDDSMREIIADQERLWEEITDEYKRAPKTSEAVEDMDQATLDKTRALASSTNKINLEDEIQGQQVLLEQWNSLSATLNNIILN